MENYSTAGTAGHPKNGSFRGDIHPAFNAHNMQEMVAYMESERHLNSKIQKITMRIREHYPELSPNLAHMHETMPNSRNLQITPKSLKIYYDLLFSLLNNYITGNFRNPDAIPYMTVVNND